MSDRLDLTTAQHLLLGTPPPPASPTGSDLWDVRTGECRTLMAAMPERSVHTVVTSPPYYGLRDYGTGTWDGGNPACDHDAEVDLAAVRMVGTTSFSATNNAGRAAARAHHKRRGCPSCGAVSTDEQLGHEPTPELFVTALVDVFRAVRRVLRDDGTVWLNLGDSYANAGASGPQGKTGERASRTFTAEGLGAGRNGAVPAGYKPKDLIGIPWMVAFALRADGWYLRADVVWAKPNPMPESVTDRPTRSHEFVFLLTKRPRYHYDAEAIRETWTSSGTGTMGVGPVELDGDWQGQSGASRNTPRDATAGRNKRDVWTVPVHPYADAHFATFPTALIEPCILAGAPERACSSCGAPWTRIVERGPQPPEPEHRNPGKRLEPGQAGNVGAGGIGFRASRLSGQEMTAWREQHPDRTLGFEPSCSCSADPEPGVILDPFTGAGTTGVVAARHHRAFIGLELNPTYAQLARDRLAMDERLGYRAPTRAPAQIPGQTSILDLLDEPTDPKGTP